MNAKNAALVAMPIGLLIASGNARAQSLDVKGTTTAEGNAYFYGRVGIGTVSPSSSLSLITAAPNDGLLLSTSAGAQGTSGSWAALYINLGNGSYNNLTMAGDRGILYGGATLGSPGGGFTIAPWAAGPSGLRLDASGNVGIGARTPAVKLAVNGAGANVYATDVWVENNMHVQGNEAVAGGRGRLRLGTAWGYAGMYAEGNSLGVGNDLVLGASSGQVRIGCPTCGQHLYVSGAVHASQGVAVYDCSNACGPGSSIFASFSSSVTCSDGFGNTWTGTCTFVGRLVSP